MRQYARISVRMRRVGRRRADGICVDLAELRVLERIVPSAARAEAFGIVLE